MNDSQKYVVEIRVRGQSDEDTRGHEWFYFQLWNRADVARFLRTNMRKGEGEAQLLLDSYERFQVELAIRPEPAGGEPDAPLVEDDALLGVH